MVISNLHWICTRCGEPRDVNAMFNATAAPTCCNVPMQRLSHVQAEAARRLSSPERLTWLERGGHVLRDPGRRWRPALSEYQIKEAIAQLEAYNASIQALTRSVNRRSAAKKK
jgi:hypothetical protein